jgi:hypothetical protein
VLGCQELLFAISLGTPGPHRKPVFQALTLEGKIIGYVKVGWNEATNDLVQNEAATLRRLEVAPLRACMAPSVLHAAWWQGHYVCIQSPSDGKFEAAPGALTPCYLAVQQELAAIHTRWISLRQTAFWANLHRQIDSAPNAYYRHILRQGMYTAETRLGNGGLPFHFSHGDFAPWNARMLNSRLLLFDWEYSTREAPPGYDLFHFIVQTARLLHKWSPGQTCRLIRRQELVGKDIAGHLENLGLRGLEIEPLLLLYVLERLAFYISKPDTSLDALRYFALMATLLTSKEPSTP